MYKRRNQYRPKPKPKIENNEFVKADKFLTVAFLTNGNIEVYRDWVDDKYKVLVFPNLGVFEKIINLLNENYLMLIKSKK